MHKYLICLLCGLLCSGLVEDLRADHYMANSLSHRCLGNDQYEITLVIYTDCDPATLALGGSHPVTLRPLGNFCSFGEFNVDLDTVGHLSSLDVTPSCLQSRCSGGTAPGIQQFLYRGVVTLPPGCRWEVSLASCCRSIQLTNLMLPNSTGVYVPTIINTDLPACNSSPQFANMPLIHACDSSWVAYNHGAVDPDGDSLIFSLVRPRAARYDTVTFVNGLSYQLPLVVEVGTVFSLDSLTGEIRFMARFGMSQSIIMSIKIEEIRNGVVVGTTVREVQVVIVDRCNNNPPQLQATLPLLNMSLQSPTNLNLCKGAIGTFQVVFEDVDGDALSIQTNAGTALRGGTIGYVVDNRVADSIVVTFSVDARQAFVGTYPFSIVVTDNFCPLPAVQAFSWTLTIGGVAYRQNTYCTSDPDPLPTVVGGGNGVYRAVGVGAAGLALDTLTGAIDLSASMPGNYVILYQPLSGNTCPKDSLFVHINTGPDAGFAYAQTLWCSDDVHPLPSAINTLGGQFWISQNAAIDSTTGRIFLDSAALGTHRIFYSVRLGNCRSIGNLDVVITGAPAYPSDTFCTLDPDPVPVLVGDSGGVYFQPITNPPGLVLDSITGRIDLSATLPNTYTIAYRRISGVSCTSDSSVVTVKRSPSPNFSYPRALWCKGGIDATPTITGTPGGAFYSFAPLQYSFTTGQVAMDSTPVGVHRMYYRVDSGGCVAQEQFDLNVMQLTPIEAVADRYYLCGNRSDTIYLNTELRYFGTAPPIGQFQWSPSQHLSQTTIRNPRAIVTSPQTYVVAYNDGLCPPQTDTVYLDTSYAAHLFPIADVRICETDSVQLNAAVLLRGGALYYEQTTPTPVLAEDTTVIPLLVTGMRPEIDATALTSLEICLDLNISVLSHLTIYLIAPSGEQVLLTTNNGGFNTNFRGGTFSADRTNVPITTMPAFSLPVPNQGYFPQNGPGGFGPLLGAMSNGVWQLMIIHDNGGINTLNGLLRHWCMHFRDLSAATFAWTPTQGISCTPCDSPMVSPSRDQLYTVISTNLVGCQDTTTVQVNVDTLLPAPLLTCGQPFFNGTTVHWTLVPNAIGYRLTVDGGPPVTLGATVDSFLVQGLAPGQCATIVVQTLGGNLCLYGYADTLQCCARSCSGISPLGITTSTGSTRLCLGDTLYLTADTGYVHYQWSIGDSTQQIAVTSSGRYSVVATDQWGCTHRGFMAILADFPPDAQLPDSSYYCEGDSVMLQARGSLNRYQWSTGAVGATTWASQVGAYTVTVTDANGCMATDTVVVSQRDRPSIQFLTQHPSCATGPPDGTLQVQPVVGNLGYQYQWSNNGTSDRLTQLNAGRYCVTVTDAYGCRADRCITLRAPDTIRTSFSTVPIACHSSGDGQATAIVVGGVGPYVYQWLPNGPATAGQTGLSAGRYVVRVTDVQGCSDTATVSLTAPRAGSLRGTATAALCHGGTDGHAVVQASGGTAPWQYRWSTGRLDSALTQVAAGQYCVTATDANGCLLDTCLQIGEPTALGWAAVVPQPPRCYGDSNGVLTVSLFGGSPSYTYQWSTTPVQTTASATNLQAGRYTLTVTDAQGCTTSRSLTLSQPAVLRLDSKTVLPTACVDATGQITVALLGGSQPYTYQWSDGQQDSTAVQLRDTTYTLVVVDAQGCTLRDTTTVPMDRNGLSALGLTFPTRCEGEANGLIDLVLSGGTFPPGTRPTYRVLGLRGSAWHYYSGIDGVPAGVYTVEVRDGTGCVADTQLVVEEGAPFFIASMTPDTTVEYHDSIVVHALLNAPQGAQYTWQVQTGNSSDLPLGAGFEFGVRLLHSTQYRFQAISPEGCTVDSSVWILVEKPRRANAPEAFTPNGDGVNDGFFIQGGDKATQVLLLRVYDRWGTLIYEGQNLDLNDPHQGWDGTFKGMDNEPGYYTWYAQVQFIDGFVLQLKGGVHLMR